MKNSIKFLNHLTTALLIALCLVTMAIPGAATDTTTAPEDIRYGIIIECNFSDISDSDTSDRSIYEENVFLLSSRTSELYAIAEYSEERQTHVVTNYTANRDNATLFRCSSDGKLQISGIPEDTYLLTHTEAPDGYSRLTKNVEITLSNGNAIVNDNPAPSHTDSDTGEIVCTVTIDFGKSFDLPMSECDLICWSYRKFGFDIFSTVGCVLIIGCSIAIFFVIRSSREKQSQKQE